MMEFTPDRTLSRIQKMSKRVLHLAALITMALLPSLAWTQAKEEVQSLIKQIKLSREPKVRIKAIEALGKLGADAKEASQVLIEAMTERNVMIRQAAAEALEKVNPNLQKPVLELLVDEQKRAAAVEDLVGLQDEAKPALPVLIAMYKSELTGQSGGTVGVGGPLSLATRILTALTKIAPEDKTVIQTLLDAITYKPPAPGAAKANSANRPDVRYAAIELALEMKIDNKLLTKAIISATGDPICRIRAIEALGEMGPAAKEAVPALKKLKLDADEKVRDAATTALEKVEKD
jgi:HEAT repeat protein